ncbi:hypothetical protein Tco_0162128 [Tanacetum coccineum]
MDQMLERLARNEYYCFLDGFSSYFQIPINPLDQEKTIFTCPYGTFAIVVCLCLSMLPAKLNVPKVHWCEDINLVLNWEKCHFMVKEGIVLGHKISKTGIEVDKAKVDVIAKLPSSHYSEGSSRSFLVPACLLEDDVGRLHDELLRLETRLKCCLSPCGAAGKKEEKRGHVANLVAKE